MSEETQLAVIAEQEALPVEIQTDTRIVYKGAIPKEHQIKLKNADEHIKLINEAYADYMKSNTEIHALALSIENRRILLGTRLHSAKQNMAHGRFKKWVIQNFKDFTYRSATSYMKFAEVAAYKPLKDIHNLREYQNVLVSLGLREPLAGQGVQQLADYNYFAVFTKTCLTSIQKFKEVFEHQPLDDIDDDTREQLKEQLSPIVDIYEKL